MTTPAAPDDAFYDDARRRFRAFLESVPAGNRGDPPPVVLCHSDADGIAAGAVLARVLRHARPAGWGNVVTMATGKVGNAWAPETRAALGERLGGRLPAALIVADLGLRAEPVLPDAPGTLTFFVDHHRPAGMPVDPARVVTGYGREPTPCSAGLAWELARGVDEAAAATVDWIAAAGILSDLGDKAPFAPLASAKKRVGSTLLRDATSLLNAPRRSATGDASPALRLLLHANGPREITHDEDSADAAALRAAKEEVGKALVAAKKIGPKFSQTTPVCAVRIHTPCQVHPLVAQVWRTRFPKLIIMGVNTGFRPGFVHFSCRCGRDQNLLDFLRAHRPEGADQGNYGNGHDQAGGGSLPVEVWNRFARGIGLPDELQVAALRAE